MLAPISHPGLINIGPRSYCVALVGLQAQLASCCTAGNSRAGLLIWLAAMHVLVWGGGGGLWAA